MVNKVLKVGDSAAVTIPKSVLKEMGIAIGDKVTLTFHPETNEVILKPLKTGHPMVRDRVVELTASFVNRYGDALRRLA